MTMHLMKVWLWSLAWQDVFFYSSLILPTCLTRARKDDVLSLRAAFILAYVIWHSVDVIERMGVNLYGDSNRVV